MSIKYIAFKPSRLIRIPRSMAGNTDFSKLSNLKHKHAVLITKPMDGCLPLSKQGNSSDTQSDECKSSGTDKFADIPVSQTASSKVMSSIKDNSVTTSSIKSKETVLGDDSNEITETNVVAVKDSNPSSNAKLEETSDFISDMTVSNSDDSSPPKRVCGGNSTEDGGFVDVDSEATANSKSKVVVQVLSNVSYGKISALENCIDVSEIPLESALEKPWDAEDRADFSKQSNEKLETPAIANEERLPDNYNQDNLSPKALPKGKMRRNHAMNLHIRSGNGVHLKDIAHIVRSVEKASPTFLSFLHKILFGSYGGSNNENALSQTKQNILHFSGFPFPEDSETFHVKRKCLSKVPYQMLYDMCQTLIGKGARTRNDSVEDLLNFMLKPTNNSSEEQQLKTNENESVEISDVEKEAIAGSLPIVLVQKLDDSFIKDLLQELKVDSLPNHLNKDMVKSDKKPEYTRVTGPPVCRVQLKSFPEIVLRVNKARRRIINIMHILLYGRPGSDNINRLNILEFEGFTDSAEKNFRRKTEFLKKLRIDELNQMCHIFSLRVKDRSKLEKAIKFLHCLQASELAKRYKRGKTDLQQKSKKAIAKKKIPHSEVKMESVQRIKKLKDFEKIRRNIECAPPEELIELSDLLFLRPSDNLEIHQRILDFSSSSFRENSPDFHSRRTLLYYMSFDIIKKIASLLEITDWEEYRNPQDLATTLLRFLMEMKPPVNICPRSKYSAHGLRKTSSMTHRPHLMRLQKDESRWENNFSRNGHPNSSDMPHSAYTEDFQEERCTENSSVVVRRITESSYSFTDLKNNEPVTVSECKSEESHSLYKFIQHPSEKQLEVTIREMVCTNSWSSTMGDLINKVFHCYPKFNLTYRTDFIKSKAIEVLHELQGNAKPHGDVMQDTLQLQ